MPEDVQPVNGAIQSPPMQSMPVPQTRSYKLSEAERTIFLEQVLQFQGMQRGALQMLSRIHGFQNARLSQDFSEMVEVEG